MARPADLPDAEQFAHGTRARYVSGCRCGPCTHSNVEAYHAREAESKEAALEYGAVPAPPATAANGRTYRRMCPGVEGHPCPRGSHLRKDSVGNLCGHCRRLLVRNGIVSARRAKRHLRSLSKQGVGYKSVADASDVGKTVLAQILNGSKTRIRQKTERAILAVDASAIADHGLVDAAPVWAMVETLIAEHGYTKTEIARRLGYKGHALQLGRHKVTARNALAIEKLYRDAEGEHLMVPESEVLVGVCAECGDVHNTPAERQALIAPLLPEFFGEISRRWPCVYPPTVNGQALFYRDRRALGYSGKLDDTQSKHVTPKRAVCAECGDVHGTPAERQALIAPLLPGRFFVEISQRWPCIYPPTKNGEARFYRDRRALGYSGKVR